MPKQKCSNVHFVNQVYKALGISVQLFMHRQCPAIRTEHLNKQIAFTYEETLSSR